MVEVSFTQRNACKVLFSWGVGGVCLRYLFNVDVLFCARLKQVDAHLLGELLCVGRLHHFGVGVVVFVSH